MCLYEVIYLLLIITKNHQSGVIFCSGYYTQQVCDGGIVDVSYFGNLRAFEALRSLDNALTRAAGQGIEPQYHPPKGCVLPLDEPAITPIYQKSSSFTNLFITSLLQCS